MLVESEILGCYLKILGLLQIGIALTIRLLSNQNY